MLIRNENRICSFESMDDNPEWIIKPIHSQGDVRRWGSPNWEINNVRYLNRYLDEGELWAVSDGDGEVFGIFKSHDGDIHIFDKSGEEIDISSFPARHLLKGI